MQLSLIVLAAGAGAAMAAPQLAPRQNACFIVGNTVLPQEVSDAVTSLQNKVTCDTSKKTLSGVPDVSAGSVKFSSINFADAKGQTPLAFALDKFATTEPLASNDLATFQNQLDAYVATEAGIRSVGGSLAIKVPKFFLSMQVQRIATAQGNPPTAAGQQVDHLRDKVLKNAPKEDKALLDQVTALAAKTT
ncbi:hypothetical protein K4K61_006864 [Colletotrichum sp. SAR11_59]|uniref:DUF7143 domain-containing protein n=1 Tax=Colletotrichum asianum TaxID=702518 RepID=A0A8H3W6Q9_9PEZI|nr:hypothetical protein GQ607_013596 [Colletotrichum asianum]KAI8277776.1 hypothetical protein K4K59_009421 [Colletotrichum sp. SAR11_240]KAI8303651.1 hypothetical protein K4K61_006864 [Colletotrichum sp. SAR11_59]